MAWMPQSEVGPHFAPRRSIRREPAASDGLKKIAASGRIGAVRINLVEPTVTPPPTADQAKAIDAVKHDMEQQVPMDRLICGDVGFGKTEVAIRAAFKAVMEGKQVAVLTPTTVPGRAFFSGATRPSAEYTLSSALSRTELLGEPSIIPTKWRWEKLGSLAGDGRLRAQLRLPYAPTGAQRRTMHPGARCATSSSTCVTKPAVSVGASGK